MMPPRLKFLSEADGHEIIQRLNRFTTGGGFTTVAMTSTWTGNVRWARNQISTSGEILDNSIAIKRDMNGANGNVLINDTTDRELFAAVRRAERIAADQDERVQSDFVNRLPLEPVAKPTLFSETTYELDPDKRATAAQQLVKSAADAGMLSAGYIQVCAVGLAMLDSLGRSRYFQYTTAEFSVTVRSPDGSGSGWAGVDWYDWSKIDGFALCATALDKCLQSRHPVAVEPGRYTTILEPQAVADFVGNLMRSTTPNALGRRLAEMSENSSLGMSPFVKTVPQGHQPGITKLGEKVVDERITIQTDPMDPDMGYPPFGTNYWPFDWFDVDVYHPATWIDHGVLSELAYDRNYAINSLGKNTGLPNSGAFRMSGGDTSIAEMIADTPRGILVTRFDQVESLDYHSQLYRGCTRDGLWFIENGKVSKPAKNMVFTESILFALNNIEQLGVPRRVFSPTQKMWITNTYSLPCPMIAPPMKVRDFSFTALLDGV